jgi:hypothetical protein
VGPLRTRQEPRVHGIQRPEPESASFFDDSSKGQSAAIRRKSEVEELTAIRRRQLQPECVSARRSPGQLRHNPAADYTQRERRHGNPDPCEPPSCGGLVIRSPVECSLQIECGLKTLLRILCETCPDYALQWGPNLDRRRLSLKSRSDDACGRGAVKRAPTGQKFIEDASECKQVTAIVSFPALELLRGNVL